MKSESSKTVTGYILGFPKGIQRLLSQVRQTVQAAAPGAEETIKYRMPTYVLYGKNLVHFAAMKNHIGFYPTPGPIIEFQKELKNFGQSKGAVRFPLDEPLPLGLIKRMVRFRVKSLANRQK